MDGVGIPILVQVGAMEACVWERLRNFFSSERTLALDPEFAYHPGRGQYHSTELLAMLPPGAVGVTGVDLYIPILEFVFGEAQLGGRRAVISTFRLRQELYGLPADPALMVERAIKETLHEGATPWACATARATTAPCTPPTPLNLLDLKGDGYCPACAGRVRRVGLRDGIGVPRASPVLQSP